MLCTCAGTEPADIGKTAVDYQYIDMDLLANRLTSVDALMSPTLADFNLLSDSCANDELTHDADGELSLDLDALEEFMDLTELLVCCNIVCNSRLWFHAFHISD